MLKDTVIGIDEVELHAAELSTLTTIGRTPEAILRGIAQTTVADTEGTVDENLQLDIGHGLVNGTYLVDRQLACQYHTPKA